MTRRGFRWRLRSSPLILLYHRVANAKPGPHSNVSGLSVTPEHFEQQLAVLRRRFAPLRLRDLLESPPRFRHPAVAVTFDDGYADNLHAALPLLERFGIPATFFVTSGMLGGEREFWWDTLERQSGRDSGLYERHRVELLQLDEGARSKRLAEIVEAAAMGSEVRHRTLTHEELRRLDAHDLCDVGAHTVTHARLSCLTPDRQRREITGAKTQLEEILGHEVSYFAYPFGESSAFDDDSVTIAHEAGFTAAFSGERGTVTQLRNRYRIPRCSVRDWDGEKFGRRVARWSRR